MNFDQCPICQYIELNNEKLYWHIKLHNAQHESALLSMQLEIADRQLKQLKDIDVPKKSQKALTRRRTVEAFLQRTTKTRRI